MDSENTDSADSASAPPAAGAGAQLRAAREELRLELTQIAAETRIPLRHLKAIEEGNFEALPSRAYAIGFSRTYAKAVGLDAAAIIDVVRSELADGSMRRTTPVSGMEPGDPARLPSAGLAWAGAIAALVLAVGAVAFYNSYFGAGTEPGTLLTPAPAASVTPGAQPNPAAPVPAIGGDVVITALEDGVWLRLYEEGGERLMERRLKLGETVLVPGEAVDPRIKTGRPDALAITVGGKPVARLSDRPTTVSGVPVSAAALLARPEPAPDIAAAAPNNAAAGRAARRSAPQRATPERSGTAARGEVPAASTRLEPAAQTGIGPATEALAPIPILP